MKDFFGLAWAQRLEALGLAVRAHLQAAGAGGGEPGRPVAHEGGDTIYEIDRRVEPVIVRHMETWPDECRPLLLICEGLGSTGRRRFGNADEPLRYRLIIDPIDGTRGLMYDLRPAYFLAAVAPDRGDGTRLRDAFAAVAVELPLSKQSWADTFVAVRDRATVGRRARIDGSGAHEIPVRPSTAPTLAHGFGGVANFFPGSKVLAAELMERIVSATVGESPAGQALVFEDQYPCTSGPMIDLCVGRSRFIADLRPIFHRIGRQGRSGGAPLECHPYDVAGALVAQQAGVLLTDGFGGPLDPPLDTHTGVSWIGYANSALRRAIEPVILAWLAEKGVRAPE
jgi:hypothetical protein